MCESLPACGIFQKKVFSRAESYAEELTYACLCDNSYVWCVYNLVIGLIQEPK